MPDHSLAARAADLLQELGEAVVPEIHLGGSLSGALLRECFERVNQERLKSGRDPIESTHVGQELLAEYRRIEVVKRLKLQEELAKSLWPDDPDPYRILYTCPHGTGPTPCFYCHKSPCPPPAPPPSVSAAGETPSWRRTTGETPPEARTAGGAVGCCKKFSEDHWQESGLNPWTFCPWCGERLGGEG